MARLEALSYADSSCSTCNIEPESQYVRDMRNPGATPRTGLSACVAHPLDMFRLNVSPHGAFPIIRCVARRRSLHPFQAVRCADHRDDSASDQTQVHLSRSFLCRATCRLRGCGSSRCSAPEDEVLRCSEDLPSSGFEAHRTLHSKINQKLSACAV